HDWFSFPLGCLVQNWTGREALGKNLRPIPIYLIASVVTNPAATCRAKSYTLVAKTLQQRCLQLHERALQRRDAAWLAFSKLISLPSHCIANNTRKRAKTFRARRQELAVAIYCHSQRV